MNDPKNTAPPCCELCYLSVPAALAPADSRFLIVIPPRGKQTWIELTPRAAGVPLSRSAN